MLLGGVLLGGALACADSKVPYFDAPSTIPNSTTGIQNAVTGLISGSRNDAFNFAYLTATWARDVFYFVSAAPVEVSDPGGLVPVSAGNTFFNDAWSNEYQMIKSANAILASLPSVTAYSTAQQSAILGVVQTVKAQDFMMLAETHDTLGIPLYSMDGNPTDPPYCNKDVWKYIVALLDSAESDLNAAGPIAIPVSLPPGYGAVSSQAAPSTTLGSFASFNRALAGKAGLEYAYAIARNAVGTHPTPTTAGAPDIGALTRADSALHASALYNPSVIAPPAAGPFQPNAYMVYYNYSGSAGDLQNGIFTSYYNYNTIWDFQYAVDTLHDLRWLNKFALDPNPVPVAQYAGLASAKNYVPYSSVSAPIPIVRAEELALVEAQIQMGMGPGHYAQAIALINQVHMQAGGYATPLSIDATSYTAVRDSLMAEQRISTVFEGSGDRAIALRMYQLAGVEDTTWMATGPGPDAPVDAALGHPTDYHTTVATVPVQEAASRGGSYTLTCP